VSRTTDLTLLVFVCFSGTAADRYAVPASSAAAAAGPHSPVGPTAASAAVRAAANVRYGCEQEGRQQPAAGQGPAVAVHQARQAPEEDRDQRQEQPAHQQ